MKDYRNDFLRLTLEQEKEIDVLMKDTRNEVLKYSAKSTDRDGKLDEDKFDKYIKYIFAFWALNFTNLLVKYNAKVSELAGQEVLENIKKYKDPEYEKSIKDSIDKRTGIVEKTIISRTVLGGASIGSRIKSIEKAYIKTVSDIVKVGNLEGWSAKQVASEIDNIISPSGEKKWVSPFEWFRKTHKGDVSGRRAGSVSYNSYRIARTELAETYRLETLAYHSGQPWILGFRWNLSESHPDIRCECEELDGQVFEDEKDVPHAPHPNCLCYITPEMVDPSEL
jgi:hypothetical protein